MLPAFLRLLFRRSLRSIVALFLLLKQRLRIKKKATSSIAGPVASESPLLASHVPLVADISTTVSDNSTPVPAPVLCTESSLACQFLPRVPECFQRYEHDDRYLVSRKESSFDIKSLQFFKSDTNFDHDLPSGWVRMTHPEGARYFYHKHKRVYTDADIREPETLKIVDLFILHVHAFERDNQLEEALVGAVDMVLDRIRPDENNNLCAYYYLACHSRKTIFWMEDIPFSLFPDSKHIKGVTEKDHIRQEIEAQYWYHCFLFPASVSITCEIIDELRNTLNFSICDITTSRSSTVSFSLVELDRMLVVANNHRKSVSEGTDVLCEGFNAALSRLMYFFAQHRFLNFHGQPLARLDRDTSVHGPPPRPKVLSWISPLLFFVPDIYFKSFADFWVDELVRFTPWKQFIDKTSSEWQDFILLSTVLLTANFSFLGIQSVDHSNDGLSSYSHSVAQVSSYVSTVASSGSIVLGLLLLRQHRTKITDKAPEVATFLHTRNLELLALYYALPYSLLLYGTIAFLVAFSSMSFEYSTKGASVVVGISFILMMGLVLGCILMFWDGDSWASMAYSACKGLGRRVTNIKLGKLDTLLDYTRRKYRTRLRTTVGVV